MSKRDSRRMSVLLSLRRTREEEARAEFASARAEVDATEAHVRRLRALLDAHNAEARTAMLKGPKALTLYRQAAAELGAALLDANRRLGATRAEMERRRKLLHEAMRQRKAADVVKGKQLAEAAVRQYRSETKTADDMHAAHSAARAIGDAEMSQ